MVRHSSVVIKGGEHSSNRRWGGQTRGEPSDANERRQKWRFVETMWGDVISWRKDPVWRVNCPPNRMTKVGHSYRHQGETGLTLGGENEGPTIEVVGHAILPESGKES